LNKDKLKILIRTGGGRAPKKELGLGHVFRCINLAHYLKSNQIHFLIEDYGGVKKILNKKKYYRISFLKKEIDYKSDIRETLSYIEKNKIDVLIIDKYKIAEKFVKAVRKHVKTVLISDLKIIDYPADLIVNGFIGYKNQIRRNKFGTKCLLGPKYQILNEKFVRKKKRNKKRYDLLITVGGFDEKNVIELLLEQLTKFTSSLRVKIILGPATKKSEKIRKWEKNYRKFVEIIDKTNDMYKEISSANFGICSGGITTYEFAAMKIPFAIICQVKHQLITANEWQNRNIALNLGLVNKEIEKRVERLVKRLAEGKEVYRFNKKPVVDGMGAKRSASEILKMAH